MSDSAPLFRVIDGGPRARRATDWACPVCRDAGRASGGLLPIFMDAEVSAGKVTPQNPAFACLVCFQGGKITLA